MVHWLLVAPQALKSVPPVAGSFSNKEMRTFSRIRAHQSTRETMNTSLWRRKTKPASFNDFGVVVQAPNKICGAFPWRVSVFLCCGASCFANNFSFFNQYSCIFSGILDDQRPISLPPVIASASTSIVFFDDTSRRYSAAAPLVKLGLFLSLGRSKSIPTRSSIFCPFTGSVEMSPLDVTSTVK